MIDSAKETDKKSPNRGRGSQIARNSAARLAAVQAVYQMKASGQTAAQVVNEYVMHRLGKPVEGVDMVVPDGILFTNILNGLSDRRDDVTGLIDAAMQVQDEGKSRQGLESVEPLLGSILLCGAYEILAHHHFDAPIIISDYLEVGHAFYDGGETRLINAVLDRIGKAVRD